MQLALLKDLSLRDCRCFLTERIEGTVVTIRERKDVFGKNCLHSHIRDTIQAEAK